MTMKHKTAELEGALLDAAVRKAWGEPTTDDLWMFGLSHFEELKPSISWRHGGPIIERERIELDVGVGGDDGEHFWMGTWHYRGRQEICLIGTPRPGALTLATMPKSCHSIGTTPLIAGMRAYIASKLGDEIELP